MRYATGNEIEPNLVALLDAAQEEPVFIESGRREVAVLISAREYERLSDTANLEFQRFCDEVSNRAIANGLTEAELNDLLSNA